MGTKGIFAAVFQAFGSAVGTVVPGLALRICRLGWFYRFLGGAPPLGRAGVIELMGQTAAQSACFGQYLLTCLLAEGEHEFLVLEWA